MVAGELELVVGESWELKEVWKMVEMEMDVQQPVEDSDWMDFTSVSGGWNMRSWVNRGGCLFGIGALSESALVKGE